MPKLIKVLTVIVLLIVAGCSNSFIENNEITDYKTVDTYFTGKIHKLIDDGERAIIIAKYGGSESKVIVNLTVNAEEVFKIGDKIKVGYDGTIKESEPAQINTLSVELID